MSNNKVNYTQVGANDKNALSKLVQNLEQALGFGKSPKRRGTLATKGYVDDATKDIITVREARLLASKTYVGNAIAEAIAGAITQKINNSITSALEAAIADGGSVFGLIDQKISEALDSSGSINNLIDQKLSDAVADGGGIHSLLEDRITEGLADGGDIAALIDQKISDYDASQTA